MENNWDVLYILHKFSDYRWYFSK